MKVATLLLSCAVACAAFSPPQGSILVTPPKAKTKQKQQAPRPDAASSAVESSSMKRIATAAQAAASTESVQHAAFVKKAGSDTIPVASEETLRIMKTTKREELEPLSTSARKASPLATSVKTTTTIKKAASTTKQPTATSWSDLPHATTSKARKSKQVPLPPRVSAKVGVPGMTLESAAEPLSSPPSSRVSAKTTVPESAPRASGVAIVTPPDSSTRTLAPSKKQIEKESVVLQGSVGSDPKEKLLIWKTKYNLVLQDLPEEFRDPNVSLLGYRAQNIDDLLEDLERPVDEQKYEISFSPDVICGLQSALDLIKGVFLS
jgi:hypothetical protein